MLWFVILAFLQNDILHIELDNKQCVELWCGQVKQLEVRNLHKECLA